MTPLADILLRQIAATGPLSIADYMTACLLHPEHGYYTSRDPMGAAGDFITAPEISQMFGELVGLALAQAWLDRGAPSPIALVELGPGRGTLMADLLRATKAVPGFHDALDIWLVEASPPLRTAQQTKLAEYQLNWADTLADLPAQPLFLIANEFFDALPIRQFLRDGTGWRERMVAAVDDALGFALGPPCDAPVVDAQGDIVETCAPATALVGEIGARIAEEGGVALIIDYGGNGSHADTFQAVRAHQKDSPLARPGQADLTAHVDFAALAAAAPCAVTLTTPQGVWLERLGITARAQSIAKTLVGDPFTQHVMAHRRLTHPDHMGELFKVMALHDSGGPPPGLDTRMEPAAET